MSRFFTAKEAVDLRLLGNDDVLKRDKLRLLKWAPYVYRDLNISTIRKPVRKKYKINKRTNTIDLDCSFLQLSSVSILDGCGIEYPVYRNNKILKGDDIVDVGASKNCACERNCNSNLCNIIKNYEAVQSVKTDFMPNGSEVSFNCVDRKWVDGQGFFYEQTQYPKRIYDNGVWTDTVLYTEDRKLCEVEVDNNGCVCDTEENLNKLCNSCGFKDLNTSLCCFGGTAEKPPDDKCERWVYYCNSKMDWFSVQCGSFNYCRSGYENIYNITELGDRLIFPANFGWDSVIVRTYEDVKTSEAFIPFMAIDTFIVGLMWWDCRFNDRKQQLADRYGRIYADLKFGLLKELNRYRIAELAMIVCSFLYYWNDQSVRGIIPFIL
jgi:hypothetical protein